MTNARIIIIRSGDGTVRIWNVPERSGQAVQPPIILVNKENDGSGTKQVTQVDWNAAGDKLATGSIDGIGRIWNRQGQLLHTLKRHADVIFCVKWNKKGDLVLTGSKDKTAVIWDATNGDCRQQFEFHTGQ